MWWLCGYVAVFVWIYGSEAPRLFGFVVVRRTANISMCGGIWIYGGIWVRCVVVFVRCTRYVVVINGRSVVPRKIAKFGYVVPTKTVQMTWICGTLLFRCIWICGVVSICGGQPGVLDMDI